MHRGSPHNEMRQEENSGLSWLDALDLLSRSNLTANITSDEHGNSTACFYSGDRCVGVVEFFSPEREPHPAVAVIIAKDRYDSVRMGKTFIQWLGDEHLRRERESIQTESGFPLQEMQELFERFKRTADFFEIAFASIM